MEFQKIYLCYSLSSIDKQHIENGNRIIMPLSAFDKLVTLNIDYPMLFKIKNHSGERASHCGVLEFTADEGTVLMPQWMLRNLQLQEGGIVVIENVSLRKGSFVKLQPHTKDFLNICNPKEFLESALRAYSCLTVSDTIVLPYENKKYYINIVETQPSNAISIVDTDCEVDFALPLDYEEPKKQLKKPEIATVNSEATVQEKDEKAKAEISPSMGRGRRLDGKPSELSAAYETCHECFEGMDHTLSASTSRPSRNTSERTKVFSGQQAQEEEMPKFNAFTGKKYMLGSEVGPSMCKEENGESEDCTPNSRGNGWRLPGKHCMSSDEEMKSDISASISKGKGKCLQEKLSKSSIPSTSTFNCSGINEVSSNLQAQKEEDPKLEPFTKNHYTPAAANPTTSAGKPARCPSSTVQSPAPTPSGQKLSWWVQVQELYEQVDPAISPSMGRGRRLDGKPSQPTLASAATPSQQLVSDLNASHIPSTKERINKVHPTMRAQREEDPEFEPFTGKGYMLGDS